MSAWHRAVVATLFAIVLTPATAFAAPKVDKPKVSNWSKFISPPRQRLATSAGDRWLLPDVSAFEIAGPEKPMVRWTGRKVKMKMRVQLW
jgi:hypothetical protein